MAWLYLVLVAAVPSGLVFWSCRGGKTRETLPLCASTSGIVFAGMYALGALHIVFGG